MDGTRSWGKIDWEVRGHVVHLHPAARELSESGERAQVVHVVIAESVDQEHEQRPGREALLPREQQQQQRGEQEG
ncbi:hypothetical protein F7725_009569 [Dissostichus mawsoni]|uniref:Uncharacterized protein n=1 Tax=Dissostichus mawsoni TaxID=36200 RepID=A0A7J5XLG2_DISMA|nr:hypothetical protein F7725_009569 [Dissostichus mawsoni]